MGAKVRKIKRGEEASIAGKAQERGKIPLTAEIVEGMVDRYFRKRFDKAADTPEFHRVMWGDCCAEYQYVAEIAPRDHAKSTAGTHSYGLTELLFRHRDNCVIVSNTEDQAATFLKEMKSECENNEGIVTDFGIDAFIKDNDTEWICQLEDGYKFRVTAYGSEQQLRGAKWEQKRPNLFLLDDFENVEQMRDPERRKKIREVFLDDIIPAGSVDALYRVFGTILHDDSMLARLSRNRLWKSRVFRAHNSFDDFGGILWPQKWTEERLRAKREMYISEGNAEGYSKEYLNDPQPPEISFFKPEYFQPMTGQALDMHAKRRFRYYSAGDMATGSTTSQDYSVIITAGVDEMGYLYVVDVRRGRWDTAKFVEEMFNVHNTYNPELFALEKGGLEKAIGPWLNAQMLEKGIYINLETISTGNKNKESRASSIQAKCKARHVYFDLEAPWFAAFKDELTRFPNGRNDDQVDSFAYIGLLLAKFQTANTEEEHEDEEYAERFPPDEQDTGRNAITGY